MAPSVEGKPLSSFLYLMKCSLTIFGSVKVYELITSVRRANENARNLVQFLINIYEKKKGVVMPR